ncbi:hypothetical protein HELRODRAFT_109307 [Helobdella robusta]|uniref:SLC41A/MgtE integral membrane domain-containing protein n=1 Tax=Helobdella robusta TaxID=6412 RepID=T1EES2_HELRO|nr:hypothetical protein HELRODRAFT_109307 [Helobdella robusta]ESO11061.1 hypothetical protein HELRODRAFT_109307 [Helobdella robusta]
MNESTWEIIRELMIPYFIAGIGMVAAGSVLDYFKQWKVFIEVPEVVILVPALLGLKGNLEMTLAARLSTQSNLGKLDTVSECLEIFGGNMALTQLQALVVGLLASLLAIFFSWLQANDVNGWKVLMLCASSSLTASLASLFLGLLMCMVVLFSRQLKINPDNVATPIAGSLGDLTTTILLAIISNFFHSSIVQLPSFVFVIIILLICMLPVLTWISATNKYTKHVLYSGWTPIIGAMTISSIGGIVLDETIVRYEELAVFQLVFNGIGGNLVAIQASKLSTSLYKMGQPGLIVHYTMTGHRTNFLGGFCCDNLGSKSMRALMLMVVPGHMVFLLCIWTVHQNDLELIEETHNLKFTCFYLSATLIQVLILLYAAYWLVLWQWNLSLDPDTCSIPYLTALGDFLGIILLAAAFQLHTYF